MNWISETWINTLGWTLVHSQWVITLFALALRLMLTIIPNKLAKVRYLASVVTLLMSVVTLSVIGAYVYQPVAVVKANVSSLTTSAIAVAASETESSTSPTMLVHQINNQLQKWLAPHLSGILIIWMSGVLFFILRGTGKIFYLHRLSSLDTQPLNEHWQPTVEKLTEALRLQRKFVIRVSSKIRSPFVAGFFKPVILLPLSSFSQLSPEQLEAIIAHELAHIRRWDDVVNWIQIAVEIILFYHPAVWWISQVIRDEREKCCDDLAVATCGNALVYAKALTQLESLPAPTSSLALALSRSGKGLLARIERLLQPKNTSTTKNSIVPVSITLMLLAALIVNLQLQTSNAPSTQWNSPIYSGAIIGLQLPNELEQSNPSTDSPWKPVLPDWLSEGAMDTVPSEIEASRSADESEPGYRVYSYPPAKMFFADTMPHPLLNIDSLESARSFHSGVHVFSLDSLKGGAILLDSLLALKSHLAPNAYVFSVDTFPNAFSFSSDSMMKIHAFNPQDIDIDLKVIEDLVLDIDAFEDIEVIIDSAFNWNQSLNFHFPDTLLPRSFGAVPRMPAPPVAIFNDSVYDYSMNVFDEAMRNYERALSQLDSSALWDEAFEKQIEQLEKQQQQYEKQMIAREKQYEKQLQNWRENMEVWEKRQQELHREYEERVQDWSERQDEQFNEQLEKREKQSEKPR